MFYFDCIINFRDDIKNLNKIRNFFIPALSFRKKPLPLKITFLKKKRLQIVERIKV